MKMRHEDRPLLSAGLVLGVGMGGFVDGIVFHQIFQLHNMLSARRPADTLTNLEINMVWDGLFHLLTWTVTLVGIGLLFRAARAPGVNWSARLLTGGMLAGWGLFNVVEGLIDHFLLGVHHVVERLGLSIWDYAFLASGVLLIILGLGLAGSGKAGRAGSSEPSRQFIS